MTSIEDIRKEIDDLFEKQDEMTSLEYLTKSNELKRRYEILSNNNTNNTNLIFSYLNYRPYINYINDEYTEIRYVRNIITRLE